MNIKQKAIQTLVPDAQFRLSGDKLEWLDDRPRPAKAEINAKIAYLESENYKKELLKAEAKEEARKIARERLIEAEIKKDPYLSAMADVETKIDSGEINENARKAIKERV